MWDRMCLLDALHRLQQCGCSWRTHTLDGNFSVPQGAASKDSTDLVCESPFQSIYSIYVQLLV